MVAVVVPTRSELKPTYIKASRTDVLLASNEAARHLERKLASDESTFLTIELARREAWNRRWWARLIPALRLSTDPGSIDLWGTRGGDTLDGLDTAVRLRMGAWKVEQARKLAAQARRTTETNMLVEKSLYDLVFGWAGARQPAGQF